MTADRTLCDARRVANGEAVAPIGREDDIAVLARLHAEIAAHGNLLLIGAEAGGGKTTVVDGFLRQLPPEHAIGVGRAVDLGREVAPLLPVTTAVAMLGRQRSSVDDDDQDGAAVPVGDNPLVDLYDDLARSEPRSVLVLEDLHWADSSTLAFVRLLAEALVALPVLVVATFRTDISRSHPLRETIGDLTRRANVHRIDLDPLRRRDVAELWARTRGEPADQLTIDRLMERTNGNPFYVTEAIDAGDDGGRLSASVHDSLVHRLEQLPQPVLDLVRTASVATIVAIDDLAALTDLEQPLFADALRAGVEANVLVVDGEHVAFRHALLAEAARETLLPFEERALHRRLAERLAARDDGETLEHLSRLANHWHRAGDAERAIATADRAARLAVEGQVSGPAFVHLSTILENWDVAEDPASTTGRSRVEVMLQAAEAASELGRADEAVRLARAAFHSVADDREARADAAWRYGYVLYTARNLPEARRLIDAESDRVIAGPPSVSSARLLVAKLGMAMSMGDYDVGADCDQRIIDVVAAVGDAIAQGRLASFRGACLAATSDLGAGLELLDTAITLLTEAGDHSFLANAWSTRLICGLVNDRVDDLIALADRAVEASGAAPSSRRLAIEGARAELLAYAGAVKQAKETFTIGTARHVWRTAAERTLTLATIALDEGDLETARTMAESPDIAAATLNPPMALRASLLRSRVRAAAGETDAAGPEVVAAVRSAARLSRVLHGALALTYAWEWVEADSPWRPDLVAATEQILRLDRGVAEASPVGGWFALLRAHASDLDPTSWDRAAEVCAAAGMRHDQGRALLGATRAHLAGGERRAAATRAEQGLWLAADIGSAELADQLQQLRARGRLDDPPTVEGAFGLTGRELEVFALLADGHTNAEIAEHLFISAKTASVHVTNILRKTQVSNRREAGRLARDLGVGH